MGDTSKTPTGINTVEECVVDIGARVNVGTLSI